MRRIGVQRHEVAVADGRCAPHRDTHGGQKVATCSASWSPAIGPPSGSGR
jgi:hypothetical protein